MKKDRVLVVVDVQEEFKKCISKEYLKNLRQYVRTGKWDEVVVIVDMNNITALIPKWLYDKADIIITKHFGGDIEYVKKQAKEEEMIIIQEDKSWRCTYSNCLIIAIDNDHETFEVPKELEELSQKLKNKNVTLIGGAEGECLQDVEETFLYFGITPRLNQTYTYGCSDCDTKNVFFDEDYNLIEIN